jgi:multidrug efflux system membrane fusion protein
MDEQVTMRGVEGGESDERVTARAPAPPTRRRLLVRGAVTLVVLLAAGLLAWHWFATRPGPAGGGGPSGAAMAQPVGVAVAATGDIRIIRDALGTVTPLATVTVKTQIAGQLQDVGFTEGQIVHKGDFLAQIDPRPYQALLEQYEGQLGRDQALVRQAQADLVRYQTLLKQDSISRQQEEDQQFLVEQYQAAVRSDQGQIDTQKLNLTYCHIVSPVAGRVGLRQVDPGNYVQTSDPNGIVVVTALQPISVLFSLPEDDLGGVMGRIGAGATLAAAAYDRANQTKLADGTLATVDNQIDTTTGTVKMRALFDNADGRLFPNQFVNIRLLENTHQGVVTVPAAAVQRGGPGIYVWLVGANGTVSVHAIQIGPTDGDRVEVTSGLAAGDQVVVDGTDRLRDGARVTVQAPAAAAASGTGEAAAAPKHRQHQDPAPPNATP